MSRDPLTLLREIKERESEYFLLLNFLLYLVHDSHPLSDGELGTHVRELVGAPRDPTMRRVIYTFMDIDYDDVVEAHAWAADQYLSQMGPTEEP